MTQIILAFTATITGRCVLDEEALHEVAMAEKKSLIQAGAERIDNIIGDNTQFHGRLRLTQVRVPVSKVKVLPPRRPSYDEDIGDSPPDSEELEAAGEIWDRESKKES